MLRAIFCTCFWLSAFLLAGKAQSFAGLLPDGYAGVLGADYQPAALAANGLKADVLITGFTSSFGNDYLALKRGLFFGRGWGELDSENYPGYLREELNGRDKFLVQDLSIHLPSAMVALNPRQSLALTARVRALVNADGVGEPGARFAYYLLDIPEQWEQPYEHGGMRLQALTYLELGLAFAQVIRDRGPHFMRIGGRVKWIEGMEGLYLFSEGGSYTFHNDSVLSITDSRFQYAHSTGFERNNGAQPWKELFSGNHGWGLDLGWVYEYRPEKVGIRTPASPYRFRLGFSLLDMGSMGFRQSSLSQDFSGSVERYDLRQLSASSIADFDSILKANFSYGSGAVTFRMGLPAAISLQLDYRLGSRFFLGFYPHWAVKRPGEPNQPHGLSTYTFLPRFETPSLGLGAPLSIQDNGNFTLGLTLRAGPVVLGSRNLLSLLINSYSQEADVHVALRVPIPAQKPLDFDQDGVPDHKDRCPEIAGTEANQGCPEPPDLVVPEREKVLLPLASAPALAEAEVPVIEFPRKRPRALPEGFVPPGLPGPPRLGGQAQPPAALSPLRLSSEALVRLREPWPEEPPPDPLDAYLPFADNDEDGIPNREDKCPDIAGKATNDGCPEVEEGYFREDVFQSLYFDTNEYALRPKSKQSLSLVLEYLKENPEAGVRLAGHTDNSGEDRSNADLSLNRCQAARNFLLEKGIEAGRIKVFHYGETLPAASNDTPEGRQLNRRVDITLFGF